MSDTNTAPFIEVVPDINSNLEIDPKTGPTKKLCASFYVTPRGFDAAKAGPIELLAGFNGDISTSMLDAIDEQNARLGTKEAAAANGLVAGIGALIKQHKTRIALYSFGAGAYRLFPRDPNTLPPFADESSIRAAIQIAKGFKATESDTKMAGGMRLFRADMLKTGLKVGILGTLTDGGYTDKKAVEAEILEWQALAKNSVSLRALNFGVGLKWDVNQLRLISDATQSPPPGLVTNPEQVKAAFEAIGNEGASMALTGVRMMIKKAPSVEIAKVAIRTPISIDLKSAIAHTSDETITAVNLGPWDNEQRLFYLELDGLVKPDAAGMMACIIWFEYDFGGTRAETPKIPVRVVWTDNEDLSSVIAVGVAASKGIEDSVSRIRKAKATAVSGNFAAAEADLGALYKDAFNKTPKDEDVMGMVERICNIKNAAEGIVEIKDKSEAGLMDMDTGSSVVRKKKKTS